MMKKPWQNMATSSSTMVVITVVLFTLNVKLTLITLGWSCRC